MSDSGFLGQGWSFPPAFDNASFQLDLTSGIDNINQSIDLLLKTPRGSRSLMPNFGSNLNSFVFRRLDAAAQEEIIQSVRLTLLHGEPRIDVDQVVLSVEDSGVTVRVNITYVVRQTNSRHNHVFPFSQLEGSGLESVR